MTPAKANPHFPSGSTLWRITAVVSFGPFLAQLDTTVVNVALSTLGKELNAPLATIQWVATGYLLALALMIPLNGWLVDRVGARSVYLACFALFTAASTLCGSAATAGQLIAFRVLQGMAGGLLAPMAQMMVARYAGDRMARMMAIISVPVLIAPIFGPSLAGAILHFASWRWLFFMNLPLGIVALAFASVLLPRDEGLRPRRLDFVGFLLISPGLVLLLHGLKRLATVQDNAASAGYEVLGAILLLTGFVAWALRKGGAGLIDLRLFGHRRFSTSAQTQFLANATVQGGQMLIPLYLLTARGMPPAAAGLLLAPMGLGLLAGRPFIDRLIRTLGPRNVSVGGAALCFFATLPFAWPGMPRAAMIVAAVLFLRGLGLGLVNLPSVVSAYASIPRSSLTDGATAINIVQRLGGPCATMALALILQTQSGAPGSTDTAVGTVPGSAFPAAFGLLCAINLLCLLSALRLPPRL